MRKQTEEISLDYQEAVAELKSFAGASHGATLAGGISNIIIGVIMIVAVAIPVTISVIAGVNWTGYSTAQTVTQLLPLGLGVGALILVFTGVAGGA